ncbi:cyanophycin synthetase [Sphaerospermopsis torques-reginae]|uniref:Cyanophycin synthetase n=1 Tax=Sphaerospermopsis torques-reginae ITEP-024 TaxID=984208 RepID=A0ABX8WZ15_9CYAN|nr:cyanophycin synthetase [Sphaerospermopsis torques-reginae]QYX31689.1 cyanophycin synthetase [Sphaerospermopsis torques-reginae ITEP-024]
MKFTASVLKKVATEMGATVVIEPEYELIGHITFKNGKITVFDNTRLNINGFGSANLAQDKAFSNYFLGKLGYRVTEGQTFFNDKMCAKVANPRNIHDGWNYAQELGFPVIVKPLNLSLGILVTKVYNKQEYYQVAEKILATQSVLIVERFYNGNDFRILVLDNEVIAAYQRIPLSVTGDGKSTILELLQNKREQLIKTGEKILIDVADFRIIKKLNQQNLTFDSVLAEDTLIYLLDNANLSTGGDAVDFTDKIHPDFQKLAINITKDMGLRLAGVDILTADITQPIVDYTVDYTLLEINSAPGLAHYALLGEQQIQKVEDLYRKILQALENE